MTQNDTSTQNLCYIPLFHMEVTTFLTQGWSFPCLPLYFITTCAPLNNTVPSYLILNSAQKQSHCMYFGGLLLAQWDISDVPLTTGSCSLVTFMVGKYLIVWLQHVLSSLLAILV